MDKIYTLNGSAVSVAPWASTGAALSSIVNYSTLFNGSRTGACLFKDMGKTVVSSSHTFRKIQLVAPTVSTFGVGGLAGSTYPLADWVTGYVELGFGADGLSAPTPVAQYGR